MARRTVFDTRSSIEDALNCLSAFGTRLPDRLKPLLNLVPPEGMRAKVRLVDHNGRKVPKNADSSKWSPAESDGLEISYAPGSHPSIAIEAPDLIVTPPRASEPQEFPRVEDRIGDLIRALAKAEREPQVSFIALTWFRDSFLPKQGLDWAVTPENRHSALKEAIRRDLIQTVRVANPKNPQFPTTTLRINRQLSDVRRILEQKAMDFGFVPVTIQGESLSATVQRERR